MMNSLKLAFVAFVASLSSASLFVKGDILDEVRALRELDGSGPLICQIVGYEIMKQIDDPADKTTDPYVPKKQVITQEKFYECAPIDRTGQHYPAGVTFKIELPSDLQTKHEAEVKRVRDASVGSGLVPDVRFFVSIPDGEIDLKETKIVVPNSKTITVLPDPHVTHSDGGDRRVQSQDEEFVPIVKLPPPTPSLRHLAASRGTLQAIGVLINTNDASPMYSVSTLYNHLFQASVSLKWQYYRCSFGQLVINPAVPAGVVSVRVNVNAWGGDYTSATNQAEAAALAQLKASGKIGYGVSSLRQIADMVIFVTPNMGNWLAYGSVGGGVSTYNNKWGGYIASLMHETGHNLALYHANQASEYDDYTGYMSGSIIGYHDRVGAPAECYNAANHWRLGWHSTRDITVSASSPRLVKVAAFTDADLVFPNREFVLVNVGSFFMQYNRAKEFNAGTYEYPNSLVIVEQLSDQTRLRAALTMANPVFTYGSLRIQVCSVGAGSYNSPDYMWVSVGNGNSLCSSLGSVSQTSTCRKLTVACTANSQCCTRNCRYSYSNNRYICVRVSVGSRNLLRGGVSDSDPESDELEMDEYDMDEFEMDMLAMDENDMDIPVEEEFSTTEEDSQPVEEDFLTEKEDLQSLS